MKRFTIIFLTLLFATLTFSFFHCGGNPAEEGQKAFESGNYKMAIQLFGEARKQDPANQMYSEKIALAYMYRGNEFFKKTKNIKSFTGNFEKATNLIPESPSAEFKKSYSEMLFTLADAYINTKPQNEIQKEEFLNNAITNLEEALYQDEGNAQADSLLAKIKTDNFQKMLDKGKDFYDKAAKQKNYDMYFSAEYYFKKAAYFDIHNDEVKKLLAKTRKKTLSVLNYRDDLAIAIAETQRQNGKMIIDLRIKNYLTDPVNIDINNFQIYDLDGNIYPIDKKWMEGKLSKNSMKNTTLDQKKTHVDGIIVISIPKNVKPEYLAYKIDDDKATKKYFP